jgi:hypothetical protein
MHHESLSASELGDEIFGATRERVHGNALEALGEAGRKGKAQILPAQFDAPEARALQDRREPAPDGFDFGKLGHPGLLAGANGEWRVANGV